VRYLEHMDALIRAMRRQCPFDPHFLDPSGIGVGCFISRNRRGCRMTRGRNQYRYRFRPRRRLTVNDAPSPGKALSGGGLDSGIAEYR
jgi:hypothetical protein